MRTEDIDFPCSQTFRDYYNLMADNGDRECHAMTRQQQIDKGLIYPIELEPGYHKPDKLCFADSKEVRATINHLERRITRLEKK